MAAPGVAADNLSAAAAAFAVALGAAFGAVAALAGAKRSSGFLHAFLCSGHAARWHSLEQYCACLHTLHADTLDTVFLQAKQTFKVLILA